MPMLQRDNTVVVLVDVQARLVPVMHQSERLIDNACRLVRGSGALGVPVLWTEQNPAGLGPTVPELAGLLAGKPVAKSAFSCCGERAFLDELERLGRPQVLLAGIEAHVCVYQTAIGLLEAGRQVQVVADAVSSRTPENRDIGLSRMQSAGALLTSVEMALFELLGAAQGPQFKEILRIVK